MHAFIVAIMQPYFFPYIGYFQLIQAVDLFVVYDDVNFIKQGWIARNRVVVGGREHMISLQLEGAGSFVRIRDVRVGANRGKLLKTIQQAYARAPFFKNAMPVIESVLFNPEPNLALFLFQQLKEICAYLGIQTQMVLSSDIPKDDGLKGQNKVIALCKAVGASVYVNPISGQSLYDHASFRAAGLTLRFLKPGFAQYRQSGGEFVPGLSIIDIMMFTSRSEITALLEAGELV